MKVLQSVKFRLTLWYALILAVILFIFSFFMYTEFARALYDDADKTIETEVASLEESLADYFEGVFDKNDFAKLAQLSLNSPGYSEEIHKKLMDILERWEASTHRVGRSTLMVRILGFGDAVFITNLKGWEREIIYPDYQRDSTFMEKGESFQTIYFQKKPIRLYYHLIRCKTRPVIIVQCGKSLYELEKSLKQLVFIIMFFIPGAVLAACIAGWFLSRRSFRQVDHMISKARQITAAYLKERLPRTHTGDELDRLAMTLNEMMDRIELSTQAIQEFSADISHELKTPLAVIRGEIDLALRRSRSPDSLKETLRVIEGEVNELIRLVDDLILLVRSDAKQLRFEKKIISLGEILENVYQRFQERARTKHISLKLIIDKDCMIEGDELYLKRLFNNLVDNAIKFTNEAGHVLIQLEVTTTNAIVSVVDDGMGIELEMQEKVFSRFYRTDQARSQEGAGLGLNIAKALCEAHSGNLQIQSQPGRGTTVIVELPLH